MGCLRRGNNFPGAFRAGIYDMGIQETDAAAAAVSTAPRVTLADIEKNIRHVACFTAGAAASALGMETSPSLDTLTVCILTLQNGFTVIGKRSPASPENFSFELGSRVAREDAVKQVWPLMGYALRERLADGR